jgi:hypothetical protein
MRWGAFLASNHTEYIVPVVKKNYNPLFVRHKESTLTNELACIAVSDDNETCRESIGVSSKTQPDTKRWRWVGEGIRIAELRSSDG